MHPQLISNNFVQIHDFPHQQHAKPYTERVFENFTQLWHYLPGLCVRFNVLKKGLSLKMTLHFRLAKQSGKLLVPFFPNQA